MKQHITTYTLVAITALVAGIAIGWWQPWTRHDRSITVTGQATVKATPNVFTFRPSYQAQAETHEEAMQEVRTRGDEVVRTIQQFGVDSASIRTDISGNPRMPRPMDSQEQQETARYSIVITVEDEAIAQRIQEYLITTENSGSSTPHPSFSQEKNMELLQEARSKAIENARSQAQRLAEELQGRVGKVLTVEEPQGFGIPFRGDALMATPEDDSRTPFLPGEQEVAVSVQVVFELR